MDVVKDDMKLVGVNAEDWVRWGQLIHFGDAWGEQPKLEEEEKDNPRFLKNKFLNAHSRLFPQLHSFIKKKKKNLLPVTYYTASQLAFTGVYCRKKLQENSKDLKTR